MSTKEELEWIIETGMPKLKVRIATRCDQYNAYKEKEESGALKKVLPHSPNPKAEQLLTKKNLQEMLVVGPGVDSKISTINSRGDVKTKDPTVAWATIQTLRAGNNRVKLHPDSASIELAEKLAAAAETAAEDAENARRDANRKKVLAETK